MTRTWCCSSTATTISFTPAPTTTSSAATSTTPRRQAFSASRRSLRTLKLVVTAPFIERNRAPMNVERSVANLEQVFPRNALATQRRIGLILRDAGVVPVFMLQPMLILEREHKPMSEMEQRLFDF